MDTNKPNLDDCTEALAEIIAAVEHRAMHGFFGKFPGGRSFDEWAGLKAAKALGLPANQTLDKYIGRN